MTGTRPSFAPFSNSCSMQTGILATAHTIGGRPVSEKRKLSTRPRRHSRLPTIRRNSCRGWPPCERPGGRAKRATRSFARCTTISNRRTSSPDRTTVVAFWRYSLRFENPVFHTEDDRIAS